MKLPKVLPLIFSFFLTGSLVPSAEAAAPAKVPKEVFGTKSVDPSADNVEIAKVRAHLDSVRRVLDRPTVALVLCGGGAKGAAQVGVLKVIEEMDIPVDFICGTSIGGLVGGLYSLGYDADYIGKLMQEADWGKLLTDKIPQASYSLSSRNYKAKYQLSIPFHYDGDDFRSKASQEELGNHEGDGKLHIGEKNGELTTRSGVNTIASSLPSGYVYGLNVNNLISSLSVGYHDNISFEKLPVPFYCTGTDIVSCKTKYWGGGSLKTAMRSTMSIPGLFSPVRTNGMVLIDGGIRNNFPVDIARAAGADIIIGIDLTDAYATIDDVNNLGTIISQFIDIPGRESYESNKSQVDVYIHPELTGYNMLSFDKASIDTMINRGVVAAREHYDELLAVKLRMNGGSFRLCGEPAIDINVQKVKIGEVSFKGMSFSDAEVLRKKVGLSASDSVDAVRMEEAVAAIQSSGSVESVTYSLKGGGEQYNLIFNCVKSPADRLGIGLRFDSEVWADLALNYGWRVNHLYGPKVDVHARLGVSQSLYAKFIMDFGRMGINVDASIANNNVNLKTGPAFGDYDLGMSFWTHQERVFFSMDKYRKSRLEAGVRNRYFNLKKFNASDYVSHEGNLSAGNFFGVFAAMQYNTFDKMYFPGRGVDLRLAADCDFVRPGADTYNPIISEAFDVKGVIPLGPVVALIPDFHLRWVQDNYKDPVDAKGNPVANYSLLHRNFVGGMIQGRYVSHQIPFIGLSNMALCRQMKDGSEEISMDDVAVLNLDVRVNVAPKWYVSALGGYLHMAPDFGSFFTYKDIRDIFGAGIQGSYDTIFGPISAKLHWCNRTGNFGEDWGFYLSAGFDF